jgi:hypothetical protein
MQYDRESADLNGKSPDLEPKSTDSRSCFERPRFLFKDHEINHGEQDDGDFCAQNYAPELETGFRRIFH